MATTDNIQWHITSQNLTTQISDVGTGFQSVWEVRYVIDSGPATGTPGMVRVPAAQHNSDVVKAAIDAQVRTLHAVASL